MAGLLGPISALPGLDPVAWLMRPSLQSVGVVPAVVGVVDTFVAQLAMGTRWRNGVGESESTALVMNGLYGVIRNPIFTAMGVTRLGLALLVLRHHGSIYARYAARTGRYLPKIGRTGISTPARASH